MRAGSPKTLLREDRRISLNESAVSYKEESYVDFDSYEIVGTFTERAHRRLPDFDVRGFNGTPGLGGQQGER